MPHFSPSSKDRLSTCDIRLQNLFMRVIKTYDCTILEGHRNEEAQNKAFDDGKSQLSYPHGKHNKRPSNAVDVAPYPIDWDDKGRFYLFIGYVKRVAEEMGIKIRCGADWDGDGKTTDQSFHDLPHVELL